MNKPDSNIYVYLYDADGSDADIDLKDVDIKKLKDRQLLWVTILKRDEKLITDVAAALSIEDVPLKSILKTEERPKIDTFDNFYRIFIVSVETRKNRELKRVPIDLLVGENFIISIHDGSVDYFTKFRKREKGETNIGELNAESFLMSLLDLHLLSYFRALEAIEEQVDHFDEQILKKDLNTADFLSDVVKLRLDVSNIRSWLTPHRDVFYALARPDFLPEAPAGARENFQLLNQHFDKVIEAVEDGRRTVISLFDLYDTKSAQKLNIVMRRLTFITVLVGMLGVIAGVLGMNFDLAFFKDPNGFWMAMALMAVFSVGLTIAARVMRWL